MSDTPSPDIPDPASPTPARPRRVITRPDTMKAARQPGTVITRPDSTKSTRPSGTYAADYGSDPNWKRGVAIMWLLFGAAAVAEFFRALFMVLTGNPGLPYQYETGRIVAEAAMFLLLWVGWSWPRWVLVAVDFLFGAWFVITIVAPLPTAAGAGAVAHAPPGITTIPQLALGMIYLGSAAYFAFAADVIGFVRHRRAEGRKWMVVPVALIVGVYAVAMLNVQAYCTKVFEGWRADAGRFATESLQAMNEHWDVATYDQRADADYLKVWTDDQRKLTFGTLSGLGQAQTLNAVTVGPAQPGLNRTGSGFLVRYHCEFGKTRFAHGSTVFGCLVSRRLPGGPWRLENLEVSEPEFDPAPADVPAVPATAPAVPTASPLPTVPPAP